MSLKRVLVANRGEIAVRIVRACHALGIEAVVAVSDADRDSLAARMADRAVCIGPARSALSYLNVPALITAARGTGCDAVHPGYGFLSERAVFAQACADNDLVFIDDIRPHRPLIRGDQGVHRTGSPCNTENGQQTRSTRTGARMRRAAR